MDDLGMLELRIDVVTICLNNVIVATFKFTKNIFGGAQH